MIEVNKRPKKYNSEVQTIPESVASREEEERHQKLLKENEEFKKQITEVRMLGTYLFEIEYRKIATRIIV